MGLPALLDRSLALGLGYAVSLYITRIYNWVSCRPAHREPPSVNMTLPFVFSFSVSLPFCPLSLVIYHPISLKFHIWMAFIKRFPKFSYGFSWIPNYSQNFCTCGHSNLNIYLPNFIYSYIDYFHQTSIGFARWTITKMATCWFPLVVTQL